MDKILEDFEELGLFNNNQQQTTIMKANEQIIELPSKEDLRLLRDSFLDRRSLEGAMDP